MIVKVAKIMHIETWLSDVIMTINITKMVTSIAYL